jgi:hypothetical protein
MRPVPAIAILSVMMHLLGGYVSKGEDRNLALTKLGSMQFGEISVLKRDTSVRWEWYA